MFLITHSKFWKMWLGTVLAKAKSSSKGLHKCPYLLFNCSFCSHNVMTTHWYSAEAINNSFSSTEYFPDSCSKQPIHVISLLWYTSLLFSRLEASMRVTFFFSLNKVALRGLLSTHLQLNKTPTILMHFLALYIFFTYLNQICHYILCPMQWFGFRITNSQNISGWKGSQKII